MGELLIATDDCEAARSLGSAIAGSHGLRATFAPSARWALAALAERRFDIVLVSAEWAEAAALIGRASRQGSRVLAIASEANYGRLMPLLACGACDVVEPDGDPRWQLELAIEKSAAREKLCSYVIQSSLELLAVPAAAHMLAVFMRARAGALLNVDSTAALALDLAEVRAQIYLELALERGDALLS